MNRSFKQLSVEYDRRIADAGFRPVAEFKAEFFRRAAMLPSQRFQRFRIVCRSGAIAALFLLGIGAGIFFLAHPEPPSETSLLAESRKLFAPDNLGISLVNNELFTFDRTGPRKSDWLFELDLTPLGNGKPIKIQFIAASGESVKIDTPLFKGEFWVYRIDKNLFAVESNCRIRQPGGPELELEGFGPMPVNMVQTEKSGPFIVTRKVMML